jgi:NhaA family Na+:H+ antiporter
VIALVWANVAAAHYEDFWHAEIGFISVGGFEATTDLRHLVVDGLMAVFFFVVGMEIKRELTVGELKERRVALLPVFAAIGGMVLPALLFTVVTAGDSEALRGWGIPMATDIAFAVGAISLLSKHVPNQLAAFLLAVAVVDDIGAIAVIAIFYSDGIQVLWLAAAVAGLGIIHGMVRAHVYSWVPYVVLGLGVWAAVQQSGVHATIAGVAIGLLMPVYSRRGDRSACPEAASIIDELASGVASHSAEIGRWQRLQLLGRESVPMLERYEHHLHPWSSFVILPLFALSEAGIVIRGDTVSEALGSSITHGVILGLVVGKTMGIFLGAYIATRIRIADLPAGVTWPHILGVGALAGIGFTVAIFVAGLAYSNQALVDEAKFGILAASILAGLLGALILRFISKSGRSRTGAGELEPA